MKRFEKMKKFFSVENIEKLKVGQRVLIYDKIFKNERKKHYDVVKWDNYYIKNSKGDFIELNNKYNLFNYLLGKNNIIKYIYEYIKNLFQKNNSCLYNYGTHLISGFPGAGKTLLSNYIINNVDRSKYFFYTTKEQYIGDNIYYLPLEKLFTDKKQNYKIPIVDGKGRFLYGVIMDEINLHFNKRNNRTNEYNDQFIGLIEFIVSHRHQGIKRIYFLGQKLELQDTQLQSLFMYHHFIKKKKIKRPFQLFKETGQIKIIPKKLIIENFNRNELNEYVSIGKEKIKINRLHLETYNTEFLNEYYKELEELEIEKLR